jgi:hypothetical protein
LKKAIDKIEVIARYVGLAANLLTASLAVFRNFDSNRATKVETEQMLKDAE